MTGVIADHRDDQLPSHSPGRLSVADTESTTSSLATSPWRSPVRVASDSPFLTHINRHNNTRESSLVFRDGERAIDLVLVWTDETPSNNSETQELEGGGQEVAESRRREKRAVFKRNLTAEGLHLETEHRENSFDRRTYFLKIHVPWKVMNRYAEIMNLKMPTKRFITVSSNAWESEEQDNVTSEREERLHGIHEVLQNGCNELEGRLSEALGCNAGHQEPSFLASAVAKPREEKFVVKDREVEFTSAQRSQVAWQILLRCRYDDYDKDKVGIRRLLSNQTYLAAFPLHEGPYDTDLPGEMLDRRRLYLEWARAGTWYRRQPLWLVRKYFGDKIGLYFAWLGFYTEMLVPASVVGLLCFLYGCLSLGSPDNVPSREICDIQLAGNLTLCPLCDKACDYQKLKESCFFAQLTYFFDNPATVFFAIFMSFWATSFLELWKRQQAVIAWEWDLQHVEDEQDPRPEFEASVKTFRTNPVTGRREPFLPAWSKAIRMLATGSMVLFMVCVVLCAVLGTIIYRISVVSVMYGSGGNFLKRHAKIVTSMSAAMINLVIIMVLTKFYHRLALWLTNLENPRTQTEYEDNFTFKIFVFEFMNFYSSLIYIAFFKGRFFVHPGDADARRSEFLRLKGDVCDPAGCLSELCIQLAIIMIGKQGLNNFVELLLPKLENWYRKRTHRSQTHDKARSLTRWEVDYQLQDPGRLALFQEYLEMVLQYGFVTLFVAAFPLAPLFALVNNVGEIRLDAYKMLTQARRPLSERVEDIGAWYGILQAITYLAVVSNAFVIAYTSDFIPRMVFKFGYSANSTLDGYMQSSLSMFNTSDYAADMGADPDSPTPPVCWYRGYRNPPGTPAQYDLSPQYWHVFAARLAFVVVFEHIVFALTGIMAYAIPDVPSEVRTQIQRERLLEREAKFENRRRELSRSASEGTPAPSAGEPPPLFSARHRKATLQNSLWEVT